MPIKPVIVWSGSQLSTTAGLVSYQWLLNGTAINGATTNTHTPVATGNFTVTVKNAAGCSNTSDPFQLVVTATTPIPSSSNTTISLYPNPASNETWIELTQIPTTNTQIKLINSLGMVVQSFYTKQKLNKIPLQGLSKGFYYIEVNDGKGKHTLRLLIK